MGINLVYERANKDAYDILMAGNQMSTAAELGENITNIIFPTILNKIGDVITRSDLIDRNYSQFKLPLSEYGAITEYLVSNMIKAANSSPTATGSVIEDMVINNPDIRATYASKNISANYAMTIQKDKWLDAIDSRNMKALASMIAIAFQSLYDGIAHDHDSFIPALFGSLYAESKATSKRKIPKFTGANVEEYSKSIFATLNKAIRDMTKWRRTDFNYLNAEMADAKDDLILVAFDNNVDGRDQTVLDIITSQLNIGPQARAVALGSSLGLRDVYEMPSMGIISNSVTRAYGIASLAGMQTADMSAGIQTPPHPDIKFALCGRGALNVGLKRLQADTGRSIRGHFDQTWVEPTLQLAFGAGQVIFFSDAEDEGE